MRQELAQRVKIGKENEEVILSWLKSLPKVKEVFDVREDEDKHDEDIDFVALFSNGEVNRIEVKRHEGMTKADYLVFQSHKIYKRYPGNEFIVGWGWRSTADTLMVRDSDSKNCYVFSMGHLKSKISSLATKGKIQLLYMDMGKCIAYNYIVPLKFLEFKKYKVS